MRGMCDDRRLACNVGFALFALVLAVLPAGCAARGGTAYLGPDPGGGFSCSHNAFEDCANP
jgi:hypothetical protein